MLFAQAMWNPEVGVAAAIGAFLLLLAVDLWSAPDCQTQEETTDLRAPHNKVGSNRTL